MKKLCISLLLLTVSSGFLFSQTAVNKIAKDVCGKLKDPSFLNKATDKEMDAFIEDEFIKYKDQIREENGVDAASIIDDEDLSMEFGEKIAMEMLTVCPLTVKKYFSLINDSDRYDEEEDE